VDDLPGQQTDEVDSLLAVGQAVVFPCDDRAVEDAVAAWPSCVTSSLQCRFRSRPAVGLVDRREPVFLFRLTDVPVMPLPRSSP
jgi:hypothetical protein